MWYLRENATTVVVAASACSASASCLLRRIAEVEIMLQIRCWSLLISLFTLVSAQQLRGSAPVVGILAQPQFEGDGDYIAASYVKWLEAGGARSIPIPYDADFALLDDLFTEINGLLLPGGSADYPPSLTYLLDKIVNSNSQGKYFPVWGTCLGFEFLIRYAGGPEILQDGFVASNISLPLEQIVPRRLYQNGDTYLNLMLHNITMNSHHQGIEPQQFYKSAVLPQLWEITSINHDANLRPFVSTIEPKNPDSFPLYGVQYHPEKNAFEYATFPNTDIPYESINHGAEAIQLSYELACFFVNLTRYGWISNEHHRYTGKYSPVTSYPMHSGRKFEQVFVLPKAHRFIEDQPRALHADEHE